MLCAQCQLINFDSASDLNSETLKDTLIYGKLIAELEIERPGNGNSYRRCELSHLFNIIKSGSHIYQRFELRAYSLFDYRNPTAISRLPSDLCTKDNPRLNLLLSSSSRLDFMKSPIGFLYYLPKHSNHDKLLLLRCTSNEVDYQAVMTWIQLCKSRHHTLCNSGDAAISQLRFVDCSSGSSAPNTVSAAVNYSIRGSKLCLGKP